MKENLHVAPSVLVGLGWSGQSTLSVFKRLMERRLGRRTLPLVELLAIDAKRDESIGLDPGEFVHLAVRGLEHAMSRYSWAHGLEQYPLVRRLATLEDGCGGIPRVGRLAFAVNRQKILRSLRHKLYAVASQTAVHRAYQSGARQQQHLITPVWLIASFFGGTGAGLFFDVAAHAKRLGIPTRIHAVIFLPDCFHQSLEQDIARGKAVGYAMLRQLRHYLDGGEYVGTFGGEEVRVRGFLDRVYLVSGINERSVVLGDHESAFKLAAEFLYSYVFTDLGSQLEALMLNAELAYPGVAAFGLHKIIHPVQELGQLEKFTRALEGIARVRLKEVAQKEVQR